MMRILDWLFERPLLLLILVGLGIGFSLISDNTDWFAPKTGTDYVGMVQEFDGKSYYCKHITRTGYCDEWEDVADSATDVAESFSAGMLGVAKGEAPLLPADLWYASILNPINTTVFSISMQSGIPVYAVLLIAALLFWLLALRVIKPKTGSVVLALTVLPGYVTFMSAATLSGGMTLVTIVHGCGIPLVLFMGILKLLGGINIVTGSRQSATGEREIFTIIGDKATKDGSGKGGLRGS